MRTQMMEEVRGTDAVAPTVNVEDLGAKVESKIPKTLSKREVDALERSWR